MFVIYFMSFAQTYYILIISVFEQLKSLVNQDIVDHEITKAIKHNSKSGEEFVVKSAFDTTIKKYYAWNRENGKKNIISFENICVF